MNLYVANLPFSTSESAVRELFERYGKVERVTLPIDRASGKIRGFGFVEMADDDAKAASYALNQQEFRGRKLTVNEAQKRREWVD